MGYCGIEILGIKMLGYWVFGIGLGNGDVSMRWGKSICLLVILGLEQRDLFELGWVDRFYCFGGKGL